MCTAMSADTKNADAQGQWSATQEKQFLPWKIEKSLALDRITWYNIIVEREQEVPWKE